MAIDDGLSPMSPMWNEARAFAQAVFGPNKTQGRDAYQMMVDFAAVKSAAADRRVTILENSLRDLVKNVEQSEPYLGGRLKTLKAAKAVLATPPANEMEVAAEPLCKCGHQLTDHDNGHYGCKVAMCPCKYWAYENGNAGSPSGCGMI